MEELEAYIKQAMKEELKRAVQKWGKYHASHHEAYAVIKEECEELESDLLSINRYLEAYWELVKEDRTAEIGTKKELINLKAFAIYAACEAVQIAVATERAINKINHDEPLPEP